jgi:hypothetical protein
MDVPRRCSFLLLLTVLLWLAAAVSLAVFVVQELEHLGTPGAPRVFLVHGGSTLGLFMAAIASASFLAERRRPRP